MTQQDLMDIETQLKAKTACINSGQQVEDHFVGSDQMIEIGKGGQRAVQTVMMSRYSPKQSPLRRSRTNGRAEIIKTRADHSLPNMGLTNWEGARIRQSATAPAATLRPISSQPHARGHP